MDGISYPSKTVFVVPAIDHHAGNNNLSGYLAVP